MAFLKKLWIIAVISIAVFCVQGMVDPASAQAALYKFSFTGNEASGYFLFDDSTQGSTGLAPKSFAKYMNEYDATVAEYDVNIGKEIAEKGSLIPNQHSHDQARTVVTLIRPELLKIGPGLPSDAPSDDEFVMFLPKTVRHSQYALSVRFRYPLGTFSDSVAQPTHVPDTALMSVHPYWDFPKTTGPVEFEETVQTRIEKVA